MSMVTVLAIHRVLDGSGQFVCLGGLHTLFDLFINWPLPTSYNSRGVRAPRPSMVWTTFRRIWSCCGRCHWSVGQTSWTGGYRNGSDTNRVKHVARWHLGVIEMVKWVWHPLLRNQHDSIFFASKCLHIDLLKALSCHNVRHSLPTVSHGWCCVLGFNKGFNEWG